MTNNSLFSEMWSEINLIEEMGSWRNSFETVDEWLESDVWFCARDRVEHEEAGPGFSKIEPYKHVITRCRKQVEAKKRIRPRRVERWCNVRPVACESLCIRAFEGTRFARQNELKTFYVSYSFSLSLCLEWYSSDTRLAVRSLKSRSRTTTTPSYLTLP